MRPVLLLFVSSVLWASEDAAAKSQRARELVVAGKVEEAILIYRELARAHPDDAAILVNLSITEFKAKRYRDAATDAASAVKLQPDSLAANLILGSSYVELGEPSLAVSPLEIVLSIQPQERNAQMMLAESLFGLGRYEDAVGHFEKARQLAPDNPKVWYGLGRTFEALSERVFHQIENATPESPYWHALQADLCLKQRRYGSAFAHYRQALTELALLPGAHAALATIYQRTGHSAWAQVEEQREDQAAPDCGTALLACDFAAGRFHEIAQSAGSLTTPEARYWVCKAYGELASESYRRLARSPPSLDTHLQKAKTLDVQGLVQEAAGEWLEALKLAPGDLRIGTALAWSLFRADDFRAALPVLVELLKQKGDSSELNFLYGATLVNLDEPEKAIGLLETTTRLDVNFLPAHAALGQALLQTSQPKLAIPHLKIALAEDEDTSAHFRLLRAYQLTGQTELAAQARVEYQAALKLAEAKLRFEEGGDITEP
jgi:predicted Zn-dependent protease